MTEVYQIVDVVDVVKMMEVVEVEQGEAMVGGGQWRAHLRQRAVLVDGLLDLAVAPVRGRRLLEREEARGHPEEADAAAPHVHPLAVVPLAR